MLRVEADKDLGNSDMATNIGYQRCALILNAGCRNYTAILYTSYPWQEGAKKKKKNLAKKSMISH